MVLHFFSKSDISYFFKNAKIHIRNEGNKFILFRFQKYKQKEHIKIKESVG